MASDDVIELGSSDDEQMPSPRKPKPRPNAMVHIPKTLPGFSSNIRKKIPLNGNVGNKSKSTKKILPNPFSPLNRVQNHSPGKYLKVLPVSNLFKAAITNTITSNKKGNVPITRNITVKNSQLVHKYPNIQNIQKNPQPQKEVKTQCLNKLPPGITVTRTKKTGHVDRKRSMPQNMPATVIMKKPKLQNKALHRVGAVLTVEVDKDVNTTSVPTVTRPEWYVKPEDYQKVEDIEKQNNKEPDPIKYVEVTIEDSPVKALLDKRIVDMGIETPIVIEDSPGKPKIKTKSDGNCTDNEDDKASNDTCCKNVKTPHSKKRLNYPKDDIVKNVSVPKGEDDRASNDTCRKNVKTPHSKKKLNHPNDDMVKKVSIPKGNDKINENNDNIKVKNATITQEIVPVDNETIVLEDDEIPEVVQKEITNKALSTIDIDDSPIKCPNDTKKNNNILDAFTGEFHPLYQSFIDLCFKLENSEDMHKIVEKKLKAYYRQVPKSYVESEGFIEMVSSKITAMEVTPERMYLHIKDIVDELNFQRKNSKSQTIDGTRDSTETADTEVVPLSEDGEVDTKKQNQIRKLEKVLKKLHKAIQKLEEQEVNFDDDADSVYLLTDRYKERLMRVHKKICQLTNTKMPSDPRVRLEPRSGRPNGPARKVEDLINKNGAIKSFPDFHDVLQCVKEANIDDKLGWNDVDIMEEARDLFTRCGKKLQRRRQENDWRIASYRLDDTVDPAEQSEELKNKLERNSRIAAEKESALINRYADRQNQLNLEAVEIGDKEAEESPVESDDEVEIIDDVVTKVDNKDLVPSDVKQESSPVIVDKEIGDIECVDTKSTTDTVNVDEDDASNDTQSLDDNTLLVPVKNNITDILASDSCSDNASECLESSDENDDKIDTEVVSIEDSSSSDNNEENVTPRQSEESNTIKCETCSDIEKDDTDHHKSLTPEKPIGNNQNLEDIKHNDQEAVNKVVEDAENRGTESLPESQDQETLTKQNFEVNSVEIVSLEDTQSPKDTTDTISDDITSVCSNDNISKTDKVESQEPPICQIEDIKSCGNIADSEEAEHSNDLNGDVVKQVDNVKSNTIDTRKKSIENVEPELEKNV